jgi:hypothetical protein
MASEGKELSEALHEAFEKHPELTVKAFDQVIGESAAVNTALRRDLAAANATIAALQADLAGTAELLLREQALAESRSLALATMREALRDTAVECRDFWMPYAGQPAGAWFACRICEAEGSDEVALAHKSSCILAQPADDAPALAGAVLEAADRMGRALDALVLGDATPAGAHAMLDDYLRARAALRGHGAVEG